MFCQDVMTVTGFMVERETKAVPSDFHEYIVIALSSKPPSPCLTVWVNHTSSLFLIILIY